ncbi:MAG: FHA domain-containing protein, partial [Myxococcota bacterium]
MLRYGDLEERFREAHPEIDRADPKDVAFAVDFSRLLAQILTDRDHTPRVRIAMRSTIKVRTNLSDEGIETLLDLALAPEQRVAIDEEQLRAFGTHFGTSEGEALRLAAGREVDLRKFANRYGEAEALKLLDSLFFVCAVDGRIDRDEIRRLDRAARQLEIDQALINALFRKHDVRHHEGEVITLDRNRYIIGRAPHHQINLPDPQIALRHAELVKTADGWRVADLNSGRPTVVNGHPVTQAALGAGDELRVGTTTLRFQAEDQHRIRGTASFSSLSVRNLRR